MKEFPNFYENYDEAYKRLHNTIVCYDGHPHQVFWISEHAEDGFLRAYLYPVEEGGKSDFSAKLPDVAGAIYQNPGEINKKVAGKFIDKWMDENKNKNILIRKKLNSPLFNKFRPFPLGMVNQKDFAYYVERQPLRKTEQGLLRSSLQETKCQLITILSPLGIINTNLYSESFVDCVKGVYPTFYDARNWLENPECGNTSIGFHRLFALVKGPLDILFLQYKTDIVGYMPQKGASALKLGKDFKHLKEVVQELDVFNYIQI